MTRARSPTIFDFQRNLDAIIHAGEREARISAAKARNEMAARGLALSGSMINVVAQIAYRIHTDTLKRAMDLTHEFSSGGDPSLAELAVTTRQRFQNLATMLLSLVPVIGDRGAVTENTRRQYTAVFDQRLDNALRDMEIGFVDGRRLQTDAGKSAPPKLADAVFAKPSLWGVGVDVPKGWQWFKYRLPEFFSYMKKMWQVILRRAR